MLPNAGVYRGFHYVAGVSRMWVVNSTYTLAEKPPARDCDRKTRDQ